MNTIENRDPAVQSQMFQGLTEKVKAGAMTPAQAVNEAKRLRLPKPMRYKLATCTRVAV